VARLRGAEAPCLPVCRRREPHNAPSHYQQLAQKAIPIPDIMRFPIHSLMTESCTVLMLIPFLRRLYKGGSVAESLASGKARVQIAVATLLGNSLRQTVHAHRASVYQAAKLVAALLRVVGVTAGLTESNGSLLPGL